MHQSLNCITARGYNHDRFHHELAQRRRARRRHLRRLQVLRQLHKVKTYITLPDKATYYIKRSGHNKTHHHALTPNTGYGPNADKLDYLIGEFKTDSFNQLHWLFDQYLDPKQRSKWGKYKVRTKGDLVKLPLCLGLVQLHKSDWCCKLNPDWFPELGPQPGMT